MYEFLEETVERNMTIPAKMVPEMTVGDSLRLLAADNLDTYPGYQQWKAGWHHYQDGCIESLCANRRRHSSAL